MHSSMCLELKDLVDRIISIFPDIEDARPGCSSGRRTLCLLNKALEKAKFLLQYCSESSKLYMAITGEAIVSRGCRTKKSLEQNLMDIRSMVPTVLSLKISQIIEDLSSTVLALESSQEEAGRTLRELIQRSTSSSSVSTNEIRDFHFAALKLQLSTPDAIVMERRSLESHLARLSECKEDKRKVLKYLLWLLRKHERIICRNHKANSFPQNRSVRDYVCANAVEGECYEDIDFSVSMDSFGSSMCCFSVKDLNSSCSFDSPSYSKMSKGGYFMPMETIDSDSGTIVTDSSQSEVETEPLCGLNDLPWDVQVKIIEDVRSCFEHNTQAFRSMSPSTFLEPLITFLKNAQERNGGEEGIIKGGLDLLLAFIRGNMRAVESLEEDVFETLSVFLESNVVAEEALNILEFLSNNAHDLSKITSSGSLSSLLKMAETRTEHLQEQAMIALKNLSSSREICHEMVSLNFIQKLTSFLEEKVFCKHSIIILRNLCNTEKGRVSITETQGCLASIAELLESDDTNEQENAISILLQLCVQKMEYCNLMVREATDIYSSLLLISKNGTEEAKMCASELLRALVEEEEEEEEEESRPEEATTSQVVIYQELVVTTPSPKKLSLFGLSFLKMKKR